MVIYYPTSLYYLGKHEPGNCVFSVRHRHVSSPGECGWLRACGKARGRHFEHLQVTGSVQSTHIVCLCPHRNSNPYTMTLTFDLLTWKSDACILALPRCINAVSFGESLPNKFQDIALKAQKVLLQNVLFHCDLNV